MTIKNGGAAGKGKQKTKPAAAKAKAAPKAGNSRKRGGNNGGKPTGKKGKFVSLSH